MLRLPPQHKAHATSCSHCNAICHHSFKKRIDLCTQEQPLVAKHIGGTIRDRNDRSRTRRTHELPFIAGCSHFTRKNTRFRAPASSPTQSPCNIMQPFKCDLPPQLQETHRTTHTGTTTRWYLSSPAGHFTRKTQGFVLRLPPQLTTCLRHRFPSSPLPIVTTLLRHHFPSSPLPIVTTSHRHHLPSSTSLPHHAPSSPLPIVPTSLHHHSPSSSLPFVTTSLRHHFPSSPLFFVTTPSLSPPFIKINSTASFSFVMYCCVWYCFVIPPFIKVNSTASYSFVMYCYVMYCYVIYHPSSKSIPPLLILLLCTVMLRIVM